VEVHLNDRGHLLLVTCRWRLKTSGSARIA
jgi:hypothetical protein